MQTNQNEKQPQNQLPSYWRIPEEKHSEVVEITNTFLMKHGVFLQDYAHYFRHVVLISVAEDRYLFENTPKGMCRNLDSFCDDLLELSKLMPTDIQHLANDEELRKILAKDASQLKNYIIELEAQVFKLTTGRKLDFDPQKT